MAALLATKDDVVALYRDLSAPEELTVDRLLRMASNMVRTRFVDIDARIAAHTAPAPGVTPIDPDIVTDVVTTMVVRVMRNPEGVKAETVGPASATFDDRVAAGFLYLTPEETAMIAPAPRPSIGTIQMGEGLATHLERRADPELERGPFGRRFPPG